MGDDYDYDDLDLSGITAYQAKIMGLMSPEDAQLYDAGFRALRGRWRRKSLQNDMDDYVEVLAAQRGQVMHLRDSIAALSQILQGRNPAEDRLTELQQQRNDLRDQLQRTRELRKINRNVAGQFGQKSLSGDRAGIDADLEAQEGDLNWQLCQISGKLCREFGRCDLG